MSIVPPNQGPAPDAWSGSVQLSRGASFVRRRRRLFSALVLAVSVLTCAALSAIAGWHATSTQLRQLSWWFIPAMLAAHVIAYAGYLVAHHEVVNRSESGALGWRRGAHIGLIGFGVWLIGGGFEVDRHALQVAGFTAGDASTSVIALGVLELALLTPVAWVCGLLLVGTPDIDASVTLPWVIGVPVGFALALGAVVWHARRGDLEDAGAVRRLAAGVAAMLVLLRRPRRGPPAVSGIALYWAADIVALWAALRFVSITIAFPRLIVGYATGYILSRRTLPFAGAIITEVMLAVSLVWVGVPLAAAAIAVLAYRLSDFTLTVSAALFSSSIVERTMTFVGE